MFSLLQRKLLGIFYFWNPKLDSISWQKRYYSICIAVKGGWHSQQNYSKIHSFNIWFSSYVSYLEKYQKKTTLYEYCIIMCIGFKTKSFENSTKIIIKKRLPIFREGVGVAVKTNNIGFCTLYFSLLHRYSWRFTNLKWWAIGV